MNIKACIKGISMRLKIGQSSPYVTCPVCGRAKKFGVTKYADKIAYQCFSASCGTKGYIENVLSKESMTKLLNNKDEVLSSRQIFNIPAHWIRGLGCQEAIDLFVKYNILDVYIKHRAFKTYTDLCLMRQVFPYYAQDGEVMGGNGRALIKGLKKSYIYQNSIKTPQVIGNFKEAVLVEDFFSACRVFQVNKTGIALSGTNLQKDWLSWFKDYERIFIALDKDATDKAFNIKKMLDLLCDKVYIVPLQKDLKDMSIAEVDKLFKEYV